MRDRLSNMIQDAVGGCAKYWADLIADKLLAEGVIVPPYKSLPLIDEGDRVLCPICETDLMGYYIGYDNEPTVVTCFECGAWIDSTKAVPREEADASIEERREG